MKGHSHSVVLDIPIILHFCSNTLSSSILMGDSSRKKKAERDDSDDKCKDVDKDYYADGKGKEEISLKQPGVT